MIQHPLISSRQLNILGFQKMNSFDPFMKKAWMILCALGAAAIPLQPDSPYARGGLLIVGLIWIALYNASILFFLKKLATIDGSLKSRQPVTTWGYIWRSIVVNYATTILLGIIVLILFGFPSLNSILSVTMLKIFHLLTSIIVIWSFFSVDRKAQLQWVSSLLGRSA